MHDEYILSIFFFSILSTFIDKKMKISFVRKLNLLVPTHITFSGMIVSSITFQGL